MRIVKPIDRTVLDPKKCKLSDTPYGLYGYWKHGSFFSCLYKVSQTPDGFFFLSAINGMNYSRPYAKLPDLIETHNDNLLFVVPETLEDIGTLFKKHADWETTKGK